MTVYLILYGCENEAAVFTAPSAKRAVELFEESEILPPGSDAISAINEVFKCVPMRPAVPAAA